VCQFLLIVLYFNPKLFLKFVQILIILFYNIYNLFFKNFLIILNQLVYIFQKSFH